MKLNALRIALEDIKQTKEYKQEVKKLESIMDTYNDKVKQNVEIVTPETVGQDYLMHVSIDTNIRRFIPQVSARGGVNENRMVPRVHVCPTLLGCFIGYASTAFEFHGLASNGKKDENGYKGGFKVYGIPFGAALKPNGRMVYDALMSGEHWLVPYSEDTVEYIPFTAAKCFYVSVKHIARSGKVPTMVGELFVEVVHPDGIAFSKNIHLAKGCWKIEGPMPENTKSFETDKAFSVTKIDKSEYTGVKNQVAALLQFE